MSHSSGKPKPVLGCDSISERFKDLNTSEVNKPKPEQGSPVSPLRTRQSAPVTSSSSSSSESITGRNVKNPLARRSDNAPGNHSGELLGSRESSPIAGSARNFRTGHARFDSGKRYQAAGHSGQSSANSPPVTLLPTGNICPSGKILKTGMAANRSPRTDVMGTGTGIYGHGSIMRGGGAVKGCSGDSLSSSSGNIRGGAGCGGTDPVKRSIGLDPEEFKRAGNEHYRRGYFAEALTLYDQAIALSPFNTTYRSNRAAALTALCRLGDAVRECQEVVRLDPTYWKAHQRLASIFIRLGQIENARKHLQFTGRQPDPSELQKLQAVEWHLSKCTDARKIGDWGSAVKEADAAIAAGADFSPQLFMCRMEALLKLRQLHDVESGLSDASKLEKSTYSCSQIKFFGMVSDAYTFFVRAQCELALGRFENAVASAERAARIEPQNNEVSVILQNVKLVARARARGNDLFNSERYTEACSAYGEGLRLDPSNSVLYCNRAACWFKLGRWEHSIADSNQALHIQPNYIKALLRRAAANSKLEKWADALKDYEVLRIELPDNKEIAESLFHAQVALKKSRGQEVYNMKFGGEVEEVSSLEQFKAAIFLPGVSVVYFNTASNSQCKDISPFVDTLCRRYPSVNFLKVDIEESLSIASAENVRVVPTIKIYKSGTRVKEIVCPSREMLEQSVRHYSFLKS